MSDKIYIKFVVAIGVLAILLAFLGVNFVTSISALSSAKGNVWDVVKNTGPDYIERHASTVAKPMNYAGPDWIERHSSTVVKPMNYADTDVTGVAVKIAPVFDVTGAVVSDPTGTMSSVIDP